MTSPFIARLKTMSLGCLAAASSVPEVQQWAKARAEAERLEHERRVTAELFASAGIGSAEANEVALRSLDGADTSHHSLLMALASPEYARRVPAARTDPDVFVDYASIGSSARRARRQEQREAKRQRARAKARRGWS